MAIMWPKVIKDKGGIRNQFHHVIDVVPTILEAAGINQPEIVDGIKQSPIEGVSMAYTFDKKNENAHIGQGGTGTLKVDGQTVAEQKMEHTVPIILQFDESLDIGSDTLTGVNDEDYQVPFAFTGKIDKITLTINRPQLTPEDEKRLREGAEKAADNR